MVAVAGQQKTTSENATRHVGQKRPGSSAYIRYRQILRVFSYHTKVACREIKW
jgi:hypothetical protein